MRKFFSPKTNERAFKSIGNAAKHLTLFGALVLLVVMPRTIVAQQFIKTYKPINCKAGTVGDIAFHCITKSLSPAGTYYIAGIQDKTNVYVAEVNAMGVVLQEKLVGVNSPSYSLRSMITDDDNNVVIVGTSTVAYPFKSFLMKLSPALSLLLHRTYNNANLTGLSQMAFYDIKDSKLTGNYYVCGGVRNPDNATGSDVLLLTLNRNSGAITNTYRGDARQEDNYDALVFDRLGLSGGKPSVIATGRLSNTSTSTMRPWINKHNPVLAFTQGERYLRDINQIARLYSSSLITDADFLLYAWTGDTASSTYGKHSGLAKYSAGNLMPAWQKHYSFTPVPTSQTRMLLNKIATDPNGYVAEGNWWNGSTIAIDGGTLGEMILLRTDKLGNPVWSRKINNVIVNSVTHNSAFVIDGTSIFAVGYKLSSASLREGALVRIPLVNGAMDTACAGLQNTKVKNMTYYATDSIYPVQLNPFDTTTYYPINCTTTDIVTNCNIPCVNPQLNSDYDLMGFIQAGNNTNYIVTASNFTGGLSSKWIVSKTTLVTSYPDVAGTIWTSIPGGIWGTALSTGFGGYFGAETTGNSPNFLINNRYRFKHILSSTNSCGITTSDTTTKSIYICPGCRSANSNGFVIETEKSSSNELKPVKNENSPTTGAIKVIPNPAQMGTITIEYPHAGQSMVQISIANMQGKKIADKQFPNNAENTGTFTMDVSRLANGTYTVTVLSGGKSITQKFVVAK